MMFRGKSRLSCYLHLWLSEGNLQNDSEFFVLKGVYPQAALAFLSGSSMAELGSQRVNLSWSSGIRHCGLAS
jgi:hypothetical protein